MTISNTIIVRLLAIVCCILPTAHGFASIHPTASTISQKTHRLATSSSDDQDGTLTLFSPCKINLFLRIIRKRPDGFHDLASLFQAVGFGDTLTLSLLNNSSTKKDEFTCNMEGVPVDSSNLVLRALELMRTKTNNKDVYFNADLFKRVPAQAGLGGGSANAATAMWGANELMGRPATLDQVRLYVIYVSILCFLYKMRNTTCSFSFNTSILHSHHRHISVLCMHCLDD